MRCECVQLQWTLHEIAAQRQGYDCDASGRTQQASTRNKSLARSDWKLPKLVVFCIGCVVEAINGNETSVRALYSTKTPCGLAVKVIRNRKTSYDACKSDEAICKCHSNRPIIHGEAQSSFTCDKAQEDCRPSRYLLPKPWRTPT
jgi:hypothetical protein